jgi:tetratricopeptide (TPR) repeat protein
LRHARRPDEALPHAERSMALALRGHADNPRHLFVVSIRMGLANVLADTGQMRRGLLEMRRAHDDHELLRGRDGALGYYAANIALVEADLGEGRAALAHAEQAVALLSTELAPDAVNQHIVRTRRSAAHLALRDGERALQDLRPAAPAIARAFGAGHGRAVEAQAALTLALAYAGRAEEALGAARTLAAAQPPGAVNPRVAHAVMTAHRVAGTSAEALVWAERVRDSTAVEPKQRPAWARALTAAALVFMDNARAAQARPLLERAASLQAQAEVSASPDTSDVQAALLRLAPAARNGRG